MALEHEIRDYKLAFARQPNVQYLGAINRHRLVEEQMMAEYHLYPCTYDELFCISVAESQVAGAYPITSSVGAVGTTNMGTIIGGHPDDPNWREKFLELVIAKMSGDPRSKIKNKAIKRFSLETVLKQWDEQVFNV
jgi:glycosyltransferase involved in cell wall biosynthesis